jgi:hypothetical protein
MIYTTHHHPYGGATMSPNIAPRQARYIPPDQAPQIVLPEDRPRVAQKIVCTMRNEGYTDEQIARTLRQQVGGITDGEIAAALANAPCPRLQPGQPQIQTAPPPDEESLEPPELPFPDEELVFPDEPEPDYTTLVPDAKRGWWSKWWWAAGLGVVAVGVGVGVYYFKK